VPELTQRERMLAGELYFASDSELVAARVRARELTERYNTTAPAAADERRALLGDLIGELGDDVWIEPPFHCDYGANLALGDGAYFNFGCIALDCARIQIGPLTKLGPAVQLCAATHPLEPEERATGWELAQPIVIGRNVWIGGGAIVGPGVTIGDDAVIGAGSVVVKDIPARVVAAGTPCRVIREL
jgi:maltose O-acetyltransferase